MTERVRIGFIGVGMMGHGMARHILLKGYPLTVMAHRNRAPVDRLKAEGASEAATPASLAAVSDIIVLCVSNAAAVEAVVAGEQGILAGGRPGLIVADASTSEPATTLRLAAQLQAAGMAMADVPVTRTPVEAEQGRLNTMMGGDPAVLAKLRPVIECYSENLFEIGPLGSALKLKLINNVLALGHALLACEAYAAARRTGVDPARLLDVVSKGGANSAMVQMLMPKLIEGDDSGLKFTLVNARKDFRGYNAMLRDTDMVAALGNSFEQITNLAVALGHGERFVGALGEVLAETGPTTQNDQ